MKRYLLHFLQGGWAGAIGAGVLWAMAFPKWGAAGAAWMAPAFLLFTCRNPDAAKSFRLGYVAGATHYLISLYWLLLIPFPAGAIAGWVALSAYLAIYPSLWVVACWKLFPPHPSQTHLPDRFLLTSWPQRLLWTLSCASAWAALEMVQARFLSGFPWNFIGSSQHTVLPLIQIASVTGVYGISFLLVWFGAALLCTAMVLARHPLDQWRWFSELIIPGCAAVAVFVFGLNHIRHLPAPVKTLKLALVQPSIPQTLIWDTKENDFRFQQLVKLSQSALATKPDVLIWPEAAVPDMLRYAPEIADAIQKLTVDHGVWMILGSDDAVPRSGSAAGDLDYYNSSFAISPAGAIAGVYRKRRLVIFGEYVPSTIPFLKYLTPIGTNSFTAGKEPKPFRLDSLGVTLSVLICFEDIFPQSVREYVNEKTDFLLNLTNNGWFGEGAAQWQHAANAIFRAVENGVPLVRCANNGLTCWVDSAGQMHDIFRDERNEIYGAGFKTIELPVSASPHPLTFYTRHGDWFGWSCVLATGLQLMAAWKWTAKPSE